MEKKMKPFVFVRPKTGKQKLVFVLFLIPIICGCAPVINLFNKPILIFGMPLIMLWVLVTVLMVIVVTRIAYKLGV